MAKENELAFYTSDELVNELLKRETFLGMVIYADSPEKISVEDDFADFKMCGKGFSAQELQSLLTNIVEQIDKEDVDMEEN